MSGAEAKIFELWNPAAMEHPGIVELFSRCYADQKFDSDPDEVRTFIQQHMEDGDKDIRLWVASSAQHGYCGLSIVGMATCPLSPHPWISHFFVEVPEVRERLLDATLHGVRKAGYKRVAIQNATGRSDRAHMRLYRKFSKGKGKVKGSVIVYELGDQYER